MMRSKSLRDVLVVISAILVLVWAALQKFSDAPWNSGGTTDGAGKSPRTSNEAISLIQTNPLDTNLTRESVPAIPSVIYPATTPEQAPQEQWRLFWERKAEGWQKPINFFGKVVDEQSNAVAGVQITFEWTDLSPQGTSSEQAVSDASGLFSLAGKTGRGLTIHLDAPGYYLSKRENQFNFDFIHAEQPGFQHPGATEPVMFRLRKHGPGADLITSQHGVFPDVRVVIPNDASVAFDFFQRRVNPGGQLLLSHSAPPSLESRQAADWTFRMTLSDGGFVEQDDEFPFYPPESGYQPKVEFRFKAGDSNWVGVVRKQYYIAFGQPRRYGWLRIHTRVGMGGVRLQYAINPAGSRYLEAKPEPVSVRPTRQ